MKITTNKYWFVHWWYIFYLMDKNTHDLAVKKIWECLTWNVNIYYHKPILPTDIEHATFSYEEIFKTEKTILIQTRLFIKDNLHVTALFTFIKIKNDK